MLAWCCGLFAFCVGVTYVGCVCLVCVDVRLAGFVCGCVGVGVLVLVCWCFCSWGVRGLFVGCSWVVRGQPEDKKAGSSESDTYVLNNHLRFKIKYHPVDTDGVMTEGNPDGYPLFLFPSHFSPQDQVSPCRH